MRRANHNNEFDMGGRPGNYCFACEPPELITHVFHISVVSLRKNTNTTNYEINILPNILLPKNKFLLLDHDLRRRINAWHREYILSPPFLFILTILNDGD